MPVDATCGAWSRSEAPLPQALCVRPGCYEPPRDSARAPSAYCSDACREALRRVRDRERKWLARNTKAGQFKRRLEYHAAAKRRLARPPTRPDSTNTTAEQTRGGLTTAVGVYGQPRRASVPFGQSSTPVPPGVADRDYQGDSGSQPRPPPVEDSGRATQLAR